MNDEHATVESGGVRLEDVIADAAEAFLRLAEALGRLKRERRAVRPEEWLTLREVAHELGVSYGTAWNIARSGILASTLLYGGRGRRAIRRISRAALNQYLHTSRTRPRTEEEHASH